MINRSVFPEETWSNLDIMRFVTQQYAITAKTDGDYIVLAALNEACEAMEERQRIKEKYIKLHRAAIVVWQAYNTAMKERGLGVAELYLGSPIFQLFKLSKVVKKPLIK